MNPRWRRKKVHIGKSKPNRLSENPGMLGIDTESSVLCVIGPIVLTSGSCPSVDDISL